jgi:lipoprotein-anchoring transpeptidase ErfK/SrfK
VPDRYRTQDAAAPAGSDPGAGAAAEPAGTFVEAMEGARRELEAGQMASALAKLSAWHSNPRLSPEEQQQLTQLLDQVAGTVVYSTQHLLEPPYEVQPGERLEDIASRYHVPPQLLAKINGIDDPNNLRPGERLKVVRGPFNAVISLEKRELTLTLADGSYAGRFPIGFGQDQPPREGTFTVSDKVADPVYRGRQQVVNSGDPTNPLGHRWIGLGSDLGIHGTDRDENIGRTDLAGSISLSRRDIDDVFDILATGSKVTIRR